jgi:hypothetical protein
MFIKSMTRKQSPSFGQLIDYITKGAEPDTKPILHNLKTLKDNPKRIESEFLYNFRFAPKRKNGISLYHEILSFSTHDKNNLTPEIVENLGREYLNLRAPDALGYAKAHLEKESIHLHVMLSGNLIGSKQKLRLTKKQFAKVKRDLETIQKERYPKLNHSLIMDRGKEMKPHRKEPKNSKTNRIVEICQQCLQVAKSEQGFKDRLQKEGLELYVRGQTIGIKNISTGSKYRFKTLGLQKYYIEKMEAWKRMPERAAEMKTIEQQKLIREINNLDFKKDIMEVLKPGQIKKDEPEHVKRRKLERQRVARLQRDMRRGVQERWKRNR